MSTLSLVGSLYLCSCVAQVGGLSSSHVVTWILCNTYYTIWPSSRVRLLRYTFVLDIQRLFQENMSSSGHWVLWEPSTGIWISHQHVFVSEWAFAWRPGTVKDGGGRKTKTKVPPISASAAVEHNKSTVGGKPRWSHYHHVTGEVTWEQGYYKDTHVTVFEWRKAHGDFFSFREKQKKN